MKNRGVAGSFQARGYTVAMFVVFVLASDGVAYSHLAGEARAWIAFCQGIFGAQGISAFGELTRAGSGEEILPAKVRDMLTLLRTRDVPNYAISPQIAADALLDQRITESAFPRRRLKVAPYMLSLRDEQLPPSCRPIAFENEVTLAACD